MPADNLEARISALETQVHELAERLHVRLDTVVAPEGRDDTPGQPGGPDQPR